MRSSCGPEIKPSSIPFSGCGCYRHLRADTVGQGGTQRWLEWIMQVPYTIPPSLPPCLKQHHLLLISQLSVIISSGGNSSSNLLVPQQKESRVPPTAAITCSYIVIQWLLAVFLGRNVPHLERRASSSAESRALRTGRQTPQWVPGSNDEREQSTSPQNVPFGHMNYFELKLLKKQPAHKGHYDPPLSPESKKSISCEVTLCTKTVAGIFVIRVGNSRHKRLYILSLLQ